MSLVVRAMTVEENEQAILARSELRFGNIAPRQGGSRSVHGLSRILLDTSNIKNDPLFPGTRFFHAVLAVGTPNHVAETMLFIPQLDSQVYTRVPITSLSDPQSVWPSFDLFVWAVMPKLDPQNFKAPTRADTSATRPDGGVPVQCHGARPAMSSASFLVIGAILPFCAASY